MKIVIMSIPKVTQGMNSESTYFYVHFGSVSR